MNVGRLYHGEMPNDLTDSLHLSKRLLSLVVEIGSAITKRESLSEMLEACALALVNNLGVEYARIWVLNTSTNKLDLLASAGLFSVTEGPTDSVTIGDRNVGGIALTHRPILTNSIADTLDLRELEWITQNKFVAFAGHPLLVQDRLVGVMAVMSQQQLADDALTALAAVADNIASGIERTRTEMLLRESQALFAQFADNIKDFMFLKTPGTNRFTFTSAGFDQLFGIPRSALDDNPFAFMDVVVPEDRADFWNHLQVTQLKAENTDYEYRIRTPVGQLRWLSARTFPILDADGVVVQRCGIVSDITHRKEAERRVSEFYSMVSHELRTPLTSIKAALGLISSDQAGEVSDESRELIDIAVGESDRLIRLINDILDIRKIQAQKMEVFIKALDAEEVVLATVESMRAIGIAAQIQLSYEVAERADVLGDRDRIIQVLTNLLSNAIKVSTPLSKVHVQVEVTRDQFVRFSVIDQGPGISPEDKEKVFAMFQQLDSSDSRARGGTGLGLAISKAIVEQMGGEIDFVSTLGQGTTFWFLLPAAPVPAIYETNEG